MALKAKKLMQTMPTQMRPPTATLLPSRSNCLPLIAGAASPRRFSPASPRFTVPRYKRGRWPKLLPLHAGDGGIGTAAVLRRARFCSRRVFGLAQGWHHRRDAVSCLQHAMPVAPVLKEGGAMRMDNSYPICNKTVMQ